MTNEEARKFALDSFVIAFEAGNEHMIDQYFAADLVFYNHSVARNYSLQQIKLSVLEVHKKYRDLKSEVKEVIAEGNRIAFRVEQHAFFAPDDEHVNMDVMNLYKLVDGKIKEWRLWFNQDSDSTENG
ncbi:MAG: nuclear transport factor 2 family protein [Gammaproteobacteria bacterium]|nr:nuclear transport factor 2 family protein [Gammaproteobacteria bacterium]